ncbi:hypothetical protein M0R45_016460 [Rubus argutus]|uniref:Uncharacterized protein n=1 Tax=Rubus argutus TaxID=59490 RepID=A0AAW1XTM7_RUBAR
MNAHENSRPSILPSSRHKRIPIYVMMPVDAFCIDYSGTARIRRLKALTVSLKHSSWQVSMELQLRFGGVS